jgi:hypothetical protein
MRLDRAVENFDISFIMVNKDACELLPDCINSIKNASLQVEGRMIMSIAAYILSMSFLRPAKTALLRIDRRMASCSSASLSGPSPHTAA